MIRRTSGRCRGLASALLLATLLTACGRDDGQRILGHWRADRLQVQSVSLPMGPEFVVTPRELMSAEGDIRIPISSIEAEGKPWRSSPMSCCHCSVEMVLWAEPKNGNASRMSK